MTLNDGMLSPVDLELLADYLDGLLLAGPAATVARRIESDPRWATAAAQLRAATPAVAEALSGTSTEPMPDAVFDRVLEALPDRPRLSAIIDGRAGVTDADRRASGDGDAAPARVISLDHRRGRRSIWSSLAKVAAALIVLAGIGTGVGIGLHGHDSTSNSSSAAGSAEKAPRAISADGTTIPVTVSGHDYTDNLAAATSSAVPGVAPPGIPNPNAPAPQAAGTDSNSVSGAPAGLERLANGALPACLAQLQRQFGVAPTRADFGYYAGKPAVAVTLSNSTVVAVGANCGLPGRGADVVATGP